MTFVWQPGAICLSRRVPQRRGYRRMVKAEKNDYEMSRIDPKMIQREVSFF